MSAPNWRTRCDWCGWPLVADGEAGCWPTNCSLRPMKELTPAQREVAELKQEIRKLERTCVPQVNHSVLRPGLDAALAIIDENRRAAATEQGQHEEEGEEELAEQSEAAVHMADVIEEEIRALLDDERHAAGNKGADRG